MLIIRQNIAENKPLQIFSISISAMLLINIWLNLTSRSQLQGEEVFFLEGTWPDLNCYSVTGFAQAVCGVPRHWKWVNHQRKLVLWQLV